MLVLYEGVSGIYLTQLHCIPVGIYETGCIVFKILWQIAEAQAKGCAGEQEEPTRTHQNIRGAVSNFPNIVLPRPSLNSLP